MTMMFDDQENNNLKRLNDWYRGYLSSSYQKLPKEVWCERFKCFLSKKDENLDDLEKRFDRLIDYLKDNQIVITKADKISKFANGLSAERDDCLKTLRENYNFSQLSLNKFIRKLKNHDYENYQKKREILDKIKMNLEDLSLDVIKEINKRINVCWAAKRNLVYDMKRGCYIDNNRNPLDLVTIFGAGTYQIEREHVPKVEESVKNETSCSETICFKCDSFKTENDKLLKDAESLTSEVKKLEDEKQTDEKQILVLQGNFEKLKAENDKLLSNLNSLTFENKKLKEKIKELEEKFESKKKSLEDEDFWIKLENKNLKANETKFQEQIKVLNNDKSVHENLKNENENSIKSHLVRISQLENEAKNSRNKIDKLEKKLIGFLTTSDSLNFPCPKPINSIPISDNVTNFDNVKVEDCDEKSDDVNEKIEKTKIVFKIERKISENCSTID
ncbi:hypothetical protein HanRHA438_Chr08g0366421 [Helianthus annuus]|nr:hypothetical protein HanRHA438_Chr08g0366421 [Helianthus annuus]